VLNSTHQCPANGTSSLCFCSTERPSISGYTTKWCRSWQLARLASWGQPTAQLLQDSHQGLLLNAHYFLSIAICSIVASEATKTNATSSEGGRGWTERCHSGLLPSSPPKMLARFRALTQNQARGEDGDPMSLQTRGSILPVLVNRLCLPSLLIPPSNHPGGSPRLPARRHAMHPNRSCRNVVHCALLSFVDIVFHGIQASLLECLFKWRIGPTTAWDSAGHHVRHSPSCPVMEVLQCIPHSISHSPGFTTKKQHSLCHSLVKHAKDAGVSTFSGEKLGKLVPFVAGHPEVGMQGPPIRVSMRFRSSQVPERAHTLYRCAINSEDLLISLKDFVGYVSPSLGNPAPNASS